jgi:hypothetical protein
MHGALYRLTHDMGQKFTPFSDSYQKPTQGDVRAQACLEGKSSAAFHVMGHDAIESWCFETHARGSCTAITIAEQGLRAKKKTAACATREHRNGHISARMGRRRIAREGARTLHGLGTLHCPAVEDTTRPGNTAVSSRRGLYKAWEHCIVLPWSTPAPPARERYAPSQLPPMTAPLAPKGLTLICAGCHEHQSAAERSLTPPHKVAWALLQPGSNAASHRLLQTA